MVQFLKAKWTGAITRNDRNSIDNVFDILLRKWNVFPGTETYKLFHSVCKKQLCEEEKACITKFFSEFSFKNIGNS
jgi:hypothetical protein